MPTSFNFDQLPSRIGTRSVKWDEAASDVIPLWVADMDFPVAPCVQEAIMRRAQHPCFGYTLVPDEYYEAIISWFASRHQWQIDRTEILYTIGVIPAIAAILRATVQMGDNVVMLTPVYNCFYSCVRNAGCQTLEVPLLASPLSEGDTMLHYDIDWTMLEASLSHPKSTVLLLCNPQNPTGRIWTREELSRIAQLCRQHHVMVISDEIHNELAAPGTSYVPFATAVDSSEAPLYCVCTSPSKSFNVAGLQNANIIIPDADLRRRVDRAINLNETCDVNPFGVEAVIAAYRDGQEWLDALCRYVWDNYAFACAYLKEELPALCIAELQATYLMWVDYRAYSKLSSAEVSDRLINEAKVWLAAGSGYGMAGEGCLRINLATSRALFTEGLTRFVQWVKTNCSL